MSELPDDEGLLDEVGALGPCPDSADDLTLLEQQQLEEVTAKDVWR